MDGVTSPVFHKYVLYGSLKLRVAEPLPQIDKVSVEKPADRAQGQLPQIGFCKGMSVGAKELGSLPIKGTHQKLSFG